MHFKDIDECSEVNKCGADVMCDNTVGNYSCVCDEGYEYTGFSCRGNSC